MVPLVISDPHLLSLLPPSHYPLLKILKLRGITEQVIAQFRRNKIDGHVVKVGSDVMMKAHFKKAKRKF